MPTSPETHVSAVIAMALALQGTRGAAYLVATGALTNIALLFALYPQLVHSVKGVIIMGGSVGGGFTNADLGWKAGDRGERIGNWTRWAEFNILVSSLIDGN